MEIKTQHKDIIQGTKKHIIEVARKLFSEYSYLGVSMSDIAKKLNITKAALYYHFTGKTEIYKNVLDEVFSNLSLVISEAFNEKTVDEKIYKVIKNYLNFGLREKNLIKVLLLKLSPADHQIKKYIIQLRERTADLIQPLIKELIVRKKIRQKIDSRLLTLLLTSMMDGLLLEYSFLNKRINSEKVSDQIIAVLF